MRSLINLNLLYNTGLCLRKSELFQKHQRPKRAHYIQDSNFIENNQFINKLLSGTKVAASFGNKVFPCRALAGEMDTSKVIKQARAGVQIVCNESTTVHVLTVPLSGAPT